MTITQPTTTNDTGYATGATNSAGLNLSSGYTGMKQIQLFVNTTLSLGEYWLALLHRDSTINQSGGVRMSWCGVRNSTVTSLAPIGSFTTQFSTGTRIPLGIGGNWLSNGIFTSAGQTDLPVSLALSAMTMSIEQRLWLSLASTR
jgi:hypothetical protein